MIRATSVVTFTVFVLTVLSWAQGSAALYSSGSPVVELTSENFRKQVLQSEHLWIVEFFAPWCGHCQRLVPEYEKAAKNLKGIVKVGAVDCDADKNKALCGQYEVRGFPTVKIFPSKSYNGNKVPKDYQGAREARAIVDAALAEMPSFVERVTDKKSDEFFAKEPQLPKALLFTSKSTTTPLYKALSVDFHYRMILGEVRNTEKALVERFNVDKFPTLLVFPLDSPDTPVAYEGSLDHDKLYNFFAKYATPAKNGQGEKSDNGSKKKEPEPEPVPEEPFIKEVTKIETQEQFKKECLDINLGICVIAFLGVEPEFPESVQEFEKNMQILESLKEKYHEKKAGYRFMWMDGFKQTAVMQGFGVSDLLPGILVVSPRRNVYRNYLDGFDAKSITAFLDETLSGRGRSFKYNFEPTVAE